MSSAPLFSNICNWYSQQIFYSNYKNERRIGDVKIINEKKNVSYFKNVFNYCINEKKCQTFIMWCKSKQYGKCLLIIHEIIKNSNSVKSFY